MVWLYSPTFLPYTVIATTSEQVGYEAAKLPVIDNHPYLRSWRSTNATTAQSLLLHVGALILDPGFELSTPPALSAGWSANFGVQGTNVATSDFFNHTGAHSMKLVCNGSSSAY